MVEEVEEVEEVEDHVPVIFPVPTRSGTLRTDPVFIQRLHHFRLMFTALRRIRTELPEPSRNTPCRHL